MAREFSILVVDDIPLMRLLFVKYVTSAGKEILEPALGELSISVTQADDGVSAEEELAIADYDLMFLDLMMPRKDGLTLLEEVRANEKYDDMKIVVCSAVGEKETVQKAMDLGAQAYIVKPFTLASVKDKLVEIYTTEVSH